jgi:hypothetical protein
MDGAGAGLAIPPTQKSEVYDSLVIYDKTGG